MREEEDGVGEGMRGSLWRPESGKDGGGSGELRRAKMAAWRRKTEGKEGENREGV